MRSVSCYQVPKGYSIPPERLWPGAGVKFIGSLAKKRWGSGKGSALINRLCSAQMYTCATHGRTQWEPGCDRDWERG